MASDPSDHGRSRHPPPWLSAWRSSWSRRDSLTVAIAVLATAAAGAAHLWAAGTVAPFVGGAVALAAVAAVVGRSVHHLGMQWSPTATGVVQATVGNLPELAFGIFALRAGLGAVVQASLVGSVLANTLLVLGIAFVVGGSRHGTQHFAAAEARATVVLLLLAAGAIAVPSALALAHAEAPSSVHGVSVVTSVVLLVTYAAALVAGLRRQVPASLHHAPGNARQPAPAGRPRLGPVPQPWPTALALGVLLVSGVGAAAVADWFVAGLRPALASLGLSQTFTGVVVVAIAGNAAENVGGVAFAAGDRMDHAVASIVQSPVQVLLGVFPALVLLAPVLGHPLTLALPVLLLVALSVASVVAVAVVVDGESTWIEGVCLVGLYAVIAAAAYGHVAA